MQLARDLCNPATWDQQGVDGALLRHLRSAIRNGGINALSTFPRPALFHQPNGRNAMDQDQSIDNSLFLDEETTERFSMLVNDEGVMRAGFVAHEANNLNEA